MNKVFLITGPAGVGKSTISKEVVKKLDKSVLIEGDDIYHQVVSSYVSPWKKGNHLEVFWKNVISLINNYLEYGYDVVFNYIINKDDYKRLLDNLNEYKIVFKVLLVDEDDLLKRDLLRDEENRMGERCILLLQSFLKQNYNKKYIIDTTDKSINEVVEEVIKGET